MEGRNRRPRQTARPLDRHPGWQFYDWKQRYGKVNEHNGWIPRDHWLTLEERQAIVDFDHQYPLEGYRRLTYIMLNADVVAASPASVYRVLKEAGLIGRRASKATTKGKGFDQPLRPHRDWQLDVSYLNIAGTFYYLCSVLDGYSRSIVHWEIRESMTEPDVETILQRAKERYPNERSRIITDKGPPTNPASLLVGARSPKTSSSSSGSAA